MSGDTTPPLTPGSYKGSVVVGTSPSAKSGPEGPARKATGRLSAKERLGFPEFLRREEVSALLLLIAAVVALILANSRLADAFLGFWEIELGFAIGPYEFEQTLLHWIDDGLMAVFFFVVGLEIKREILVGELSDPRKAALPILAAAGGMLFPALIYLAVNAGGEGSRGWGVPMTTDIAFSFGVLALLGSRIPLGLKVFLTALAIADDLGAVVVIAAFYTAEVQWLWLAVAAGVLGLLYGLNRLGVDAPWPYLLLGGVVWTCFFASGVHATVAGVLVAFTIPATAKIAPVVFVDWAARRLDDIRSCDIPGAHVLQDDRQQLLAAELHRAAKQVAAPLQRLEHSLHPVTSLVILPLFALANAGVDLRGYDIAELLLHPVSVGVFLGLLVGKPLGIVVLTWIAVRSGLSRLPKGVTFRHILGAGVLAGVGFTMSLFIANLAFSNQLLRTEIKLGVLVTSVVAGMTGYLLLRLMTKRRSGEQPSADRSSAQWVPADGLSEMPIGPRTSAS